VIPQLRDWHERYGTQGLTIVGVHCPEFGWEKPFDRVVDAVRNLGISTPLYRTTSSLSGIATAYARGRRWC
jgi:hypothetical protein